MRYDAPEKNPSERTEEQRLWIAIRAGFVAQGTSLAAWAKSQGIHKENIRSAVLRMRNGPKAKALVKRTAEAAGVKIGRGYISAAKSKSHCLNREAA